MEVRLVISSTELAFEAGNRLFIPWVLAPNQHDTVTIVLKLPDGQELTYGSAVAKKPSNHHINWSRAVTVSNRKSPAWTPLTLPSPTMAHTPVPYSLSDVNSTTMGAWLWYHKTGAGGHPQQVAFAHRNSMDTFFVVYLSKKHGRMFATFPSVTFFRKVVFPQLPKPCAAQEIIHMDYPCRGYMDIEWKTKIHQADPSAVIRGIIHRYITFYRIWHGTVVDPWQQKQEIQVQNPTSGARFISTKSNAAKKKCVPALCYPDWFAFSESNVVVMSSTRPDKISYHLIHVDKTPDGGERLFRNNYRHMAFFMQKFVEYLQSDAVPADEKSLYFFGDGEFVIDTNVYTRNRAMRMLDCVKPEYPDYPFVLTDGDQTRSFDDCVITPPSNASVVHYYREFRVEAPVTPAKVTIPRAIAATAAAAPVTPCSKTDFDQLSPYKIAMIADAVNKYHPICMSATYNYFRPVTSENWRIYFARIKESLPNKPCAAGLVMCIYAATMRYALDLM